MIRDTIIAAMRSATQPMPGRAIAEAAALPYKVAIDALGRMHDAGELVRFGRKYSASWALTGSDAAQPYDAVGALESLWRARPPTPTGGEAKGTPRPACIS